ncbi:3-isopropylmalate dehydratase small subunit 2 [Cyanobium sp. WAJ14-Wanaka]|uniref:3-isopropylmalate dehydratase small subunit n=1 Tax=Cyanobium sp. WAJ14-Wanaka TaxID=2823725 RepID=UPI0020CE7519|nr:3-isopropylmalate dehydratase small subunit [Cyanobium sp. WAJ14-Wanaka]MCP9775837.1 3-isopropylmalate dehydratase small subunit [Cyanobium sp. WAJ14-Wanaka]
MSAPLFPLGPIGNVSGRAVVLCGDDIDTDRIIPARFLKCVTFDGLGQQVFADDRGELKGEHPFDRSAHQGASLLFVNRNFGCGSSREHAPQALMRWGIRAVVGESFAEIFYGNCLALGIPCFTSDHAGILSLQEAAKADPAQEFSLDLEALVATSSSAQQWPLQLAVGARQMLLSGQWDATSQLISHDRELNRVANQLPYLNSFITAQ